MRCRQLIKVKSEHIEDGLQGTSFSCPVALALKDSGYVTPSVTWKDIRIKQTYRLKTPRSVQRFIHKFDDFQEVKPFNFYLDFDKKL